MLLEDEITDCFITLRKNLDLAEKKLKSHSQAEHAKIKDGQRSEQEQLQREKEASVQVTEKLMKAEENSKRHQKQYEEQREETKNLMCHCQRLEQKLDEKRDKIETLEPHCQRLEEKTRKMSSHCQKLEEKVEDKKMDVDTMTMHCKMLEEKLADARRKAIKWEDYAESLRREYGRTRREHGRKEAGYLNGGQESAQLETEKARQRSGSHSGSDVQVVEVKRADMSRDEAPRPRSRTRSIESGRGRENRSGSGGDHTRDQSRRRPASDKVPDEVVHGRSPRRSSSPTRHCNYETCEHSENRKETVKRGDSKTSHRQIRCHRLPEEQSRAGSRSIERRSERSLQRSRQRGRQLSQQHSRERSRSRQRTFSRNHNLRDHHDRDRSNGGTKDKDRHSQSRSHSRQHRSGKGKGGKGKPLCFLYVLDKCAKGDRCKDRHPEREEVKAIRVKMSRTPCRYGSTCTRRDCVFQHSPADEQSGDRGGGGNDRRDLSRGTCI